MSDPRGRIPAVAPRRDLPSPKDLEDPPIRAAVVGLGFGRFHAASLAANERVDLVALCQRHETSPSRASFAAHYGVQLFSDPGEMMASLELDLLVIASRPSSHEMLLREATARGIACLVEKPLAGSAEAAVRLRRELPPEAWLAVNFELRYLPVVQELKRLLDENLLGRPEVLTMHYVMDSIEPESWLWDSAEGGTPIVENSVHAFDLVRFLLGEVNLDHSEAWNALGPGAPSPDVAQAQLSSPAGARAFLTLGAIATRALRVPMRLDLLCSDGQATLEGSYHSFSSLTYARRSDTEVTTFTPPVAVFGTGAFRESPVLAPAVTRVVDDLTSGRPPDADLEDGVTAQLLATRTAGSGPARTRPGRY